jgi:hypothetical protein
MTRAASSRRRRLAFHEAGHCVVAEALGLSIKSVELLDDESDGIMRLACAVAHLARVERIAICVAGYIGGEASGAPALTGEGEVDDREAYVIALSADEHNAKPLVARGRLVARSLLTERRKRLHAVATALAERGLLNANDLAALTE